MEKRRHLAVAERQKTKTGTHLTKSWPVLDPPFGSNRKSYLVPSWRGGGMR